MGRFADQTLHPLQGSPEPRRQEVVLQTPSGNHTCGFCLKSTLLRRYAVLVSTIYIFRIHLLPVLKRNSRTPLILICKLSWGMFKFGNLNQDSSPGKMALPIIVCVNITRMLSSQIPES